MSEDQVQVRDMIREILTELKDSDHKLDRHMRRENWFQPITTILAVVGAVVGVTLFLGQKADGSQLERSNDRILLLEKDQSRLQERLNSVDQSIRQVRESIKDLDSYLRTHIP